MESGRSPTILLSRLSGLGGNLISDVTVHSLTVRDKTILNVILDDVVISQLPRTKPKGEQERGDTKGDHDRCESESLRQRVAIAGWITYSDQWGRAAPATRGHQQQVAAMAEQADADDDPRQTALKQ
jgi:hypothetical protein